MKLSEVSRWASFGGELSVHDHASTACGCDMRFAVYSPPQAQSQSVPVLWYLSGLTCNWSNVMEKSGIQRVASQLGMIIIAPDTSPRGDGVADDEAYDLGQGAGFYLDATQPPYAAHYQMETYLTRELPAIIAAHFPADMDRQAIMGHSMGGMGALALHLKHPDIYRSVSALAPIVAPSKVAWGHKAFDAYLGADREDWRHYDPCELVKTRPSSAVILVDQGSDDAFLEKQLKPHLLQKACEQAGQPLNLRLQKGYDHSYYFVASFIEDHLHHHAAQLGRRAR